jgi:hypothetical protein
VLPDGFGGCGGRNADVPSVRRSEQSNRSSDGDDA